MKRHNKKKKAEKFLAGDVADVLRWIGCPIGRDVRGGIEDLLLLPGELFELFDVEGLTLALSELSRRGL